MKNFERKYRFTVAPHGKPGFQVGEGDPMPLRINFKVEKADTETPNTSRISIWNLNPEHIAMLKEKDCMAALYAGYEQGNVSLINVGTVVHAFTLMDGGDRETIIEVTDGRISLRDTYVSLSYSGTVNTRKIIEDAAEGMGVALTVSYNAKFANMPNGFSFVGPARVALDKACATTGLQWQIYNGVLQVKNRGDTMSREVYVLSPETGLVGIPKQFTYGEDCAGLGEQHGWEATYLLNGAIQVSDFVRLESKFVKGFFRVKWIEFVGDNIRGAWLCTARLVYATAPRIAPAEHFHSSHTTPHPHHRSATHQHRIVQQAS